MSYFNKTFIRFFKELAENNHKEWFHANKKTYEKEVKEPFYGLTGDIINKIKKQDPTFDLEVKNAVFRINRDIRFSKDKTPYKLHVAAVISHGGRKDHQKPGVFFHLGPGECMIGSGCYMPDKENLYKIRRAIIKHPKKVEQLLADPVFVKIYPDGILGQKNKIIHREFKEAATQQPLLFNKQFYYMARYNEKIVLRENLDDFIIEHYKAGNGWNSFLADAMNQ